MDCDDEMKLGVMDCVVVSLGEKVAQDSGRRGTTAV
jgi:hypothetical protein